MAMHDRPLRPVRPLPGGAGEQQQEGQGDRHSPEAGRHGADPGEANQPRPECERELAGKEREGEAMAVRGHFAALRACGARVKPASRPLGISQTYRLPPRIV